MPMYITLLKICTASLAYRRKRFSGKTLRHTCWRKVHTSQYQSRTVEVKCRCSANSIQKYRITNIYIYIWIPIFKIRRSHDRLIFIMEILILIWRHLYIESGSCPVYVSRRTQLVVAIAQALTEGYVSLFRVGTRMDGCFVTVPSVWPQSLPQ